MSTSLESFKVTSWEEVFSPKVQNQAMQALEAGKVVYFPTLNFPLSQEEQKLLRHELVVSKSKNISYDLSRDRIGGAVSATDEEAEALKTMIHRFALSVHGLLDRLARISHKHSCRAGQPVLPDVKDHLEGKVKLTFPRDGLKADGETDVQICRTVCEKCGLAPRYQEILIQGKTSLRPVEIQGRNSSYRKDDTRLHVDSFPSNPVKGKRILRFFTNVNPDWQASKMARKGVV